MSNLRPFLPPSDLLLLRLLIFRLSFYRLVLLHLIELLFQMLDIVIHRHCGKPEKRPGNKNIKPEQDNHAYVLIEG